VYLVYLVQLSWGATATPSSLAPACHTDRPRLLWLLTGVRCWKEALLVPGFALIQCRFEPSGNFQGREPRRWHKYYVGSHDSFLVVSRSARRALYFFGMGPPPLRFESNPNPNII
jgi:hypothetical protein